MPHFQFNKEAWNAFAKELRRASWGAAAIAAGAGLRASSGIALVLGCVAWVLLQVLAIVVQSIVAKGNER